MLVGVSVTTTLAAADGPLFVSTMFQLTVCPAKNGPVAGADFEMDRSAEAAALPPLPVLSVLLAVLGSDSAAVAVALLAMLAMVHGSALHPAPETLLMDRLVVVSVTWMLVAFFFNDLATT